MLSVTRGQEGVIDVARRLTTRVRFLDADSLEGSLRVLASQLSELASDRAELARHAAWSAAYWLLDATALWVFIAAYGHWTRLDGLIVAFALANIVATIPITPGGLGVMELTLAASLTGFGVPPATALLGVASWRIVNFWLPIPIGAASYLSLHLGSPNLTTEENLEGFTDEARRSAGETTPWRWRSR